MESELSEWRKGDGSVCGGGVVTYEHDLLNKPIIKAKGVWWWWCVVTYGALTYEHDLLNKPINVLGEVKPPPVRCIDVDAAVVNIGDSHK